MTTRPRPGGRSARVQESVHRAVEELLATGGREALSVPAIAQRAGVTPSTIYRRWGDLHDLLADVAVRRLRPDTGPADHGTLRADLRAWSQQYAEEMSSRPGRELVRDVLCAPESGEGNERRGRCTAYAREQIEEILARARGRDEPVPPAGLVVDRVVAPIIYRVLFAADGASAAYATELVDDLLDWVAGGRPSTATAVG
ncbi:TetR/AcrR family transcriptional regulator [Catenuloplanes atrovinosus]|uniref:AcrR family transcriptional regulator n=1 Tax=Catenuloplanes atrovinosus TaxID=137266 RepID=A0AAE3YRA2_9ACTN|nr:TetR/AcrR family transcriptional regulator [Catenuloplanes atrovinosus]MDR7277202.1 AcrR family transcriptional regulator [Catenuloplanes atrovinosus]